MSLNIGDQGGRIHFMDAVTKEEIDSGTGVGSKQTGIKGWDTSKFNVIDKFWHWINRDILQNVVDVTITLKNASGKDEQKTYTVGKNSLDGFITRNQHLFVGADFGAPRRSLQVLQQALKAIATGKSVPTTQDGIEGWKARFGQFGLNIDNSFITKENGFQEVKNGMQLIADPAKFVAAVAKLCEKQKKASKILDNLAGKNPREILEAIQIKFDEARRAGQQPSQQVKPTSTGSSQQQASVMIGPREMIGPRRPPSKQPGASDIQQQQLADQIQGKPTAKKATAASRRLAEKQAAENARLAQQKQAQSKGQVAQQPLKVPPRPEWINEVAANMPKTKKEQVETFVKLADRLTEDDFSSLRGNGEGRNFNVLAAGLYYEAHPSLAQSNEKDVINKQEETISEALDQVRTNLGGLPLMEQFFLLDAVTSENVLPMNLRTENSKGEVNEDNKEANEAVQQGLRDLLKHSFKSAQTTRNPNDPRAREPQQLLSYIERERAKCDPEKNADAYNFYNSIDVFLQM